jgi:hypothetical protein
MATPTSAPIMEILQPLSRSDQVYAVEVRDS